MSLLASVALGGALGAVARYLIMSQIGNWLGLAFSYGTLAVNVLGSLVLGAVVEGMALLWSPGAAFRAFVVVGMLGAFTTFSTFSLDVVTLMERRELLSAAAYVGLSVAASVLGLLLGMQAVRLALE